MSFDRGEWPGEWDDGPVETDGPHLQVVCFVVDGQHFAADILRVKEIVEPLPVTPLPGAPAMVEGVVELRGAAVAMIDLRRRLGAPAPATGTERRSDDRLDARLIVAAIGGHVLALQVDRVIDVERVSLARITETGADAGPVVGVLEIAGATAQLVDLERLLTADERAALAALGDGS